jgi:hypothetical protein
VKNPKIDPRLKERAIRRNDSPIMSARCIRVFVRVWPFRPALTSVALCLAAIVATLSGQTDKRPAPANELDAFMQKVLGRRDATGKR